MNPLSGATGTKGIKRVLNVPFLTLFKFYFLLYFSFDTSLGDRLNPKNAFSNGYRVKRA